MDRTSADPEALLAGLHDVRLPVEATGGAPAEILAALGLGLLLALCLAPAIRALTRPRQAPAADDLAARLAALDARAEIVEYFRQFSGVFIVGPDDISIHKLLIDGDDAILLGVISRTIAASHRTFTTPIAMHLTVQAGLIARLHPYEDTLIVARAFDVQDTVG